MDLKNYLSTRGRKAAIASATGLAPAFIWQIANGIRLCPIKHCAPIERATDGAIKRCDLRPDDWRLIWPELSEQEQSTTQVTA